MVTHFTFVTVEFVYEVACDDDVFDSDVGVHDFVQLALQGRAGLDGAVSVLHQLADVLLLLVVPRQSADETPDWTLLLDVFVHVAEDDVEVRGVQQFADDVTLLLAQSVVAVFLAALQMQGNEFVQFALERQVDDPVAHEEAGHLRVELLDLAQLHRVFAGLGHRDESVGAGVVGLLGGHALELGQVLDQLDVERLGALVDGQNVDVELLHYFVDGEGLHETLFVGRELLEQPEHVLFGGFVVLAVCGGLHTVQLGMDLHEVGFHAVLAEFGEQVDFGVLPLLAHFQGFEVVNKLVLDFHVAHECGCDDDALAFEDVQHILDRFLLELLGGGLVCNVVAEVVVARVGFAELKQFFADVSALERAEVECVWTPPDLAVALGHINVEFRYIVQH